jgi:hypothetical protein
MDNGSSLQAYQISDGVAKNDDEKGIPELGTPLHLHLNDKEAL